MNIGIDLDGVLTDIQGFNNRYAPHFFKRKFNLDVTDEKAFDIRDIFKCSEKEYRAYWAKYLFLYAIFEPARKGAKEISLKLHADNHRVFIISKRVFTCQNTFLGKLMRFLVKNWLRRNGIFHHELIFCELDVADSKRPVCLEKQIDVIVDDEIVNIEELNEITKVLCFDASYNRKCTGENIVRVIDFEDVYEKIRDMKDRTYT